MTQVADVPPLEGQHGRVGRIFIALRQNPRARAAWAPLLEGVPFALLLGVSLWLSAMVGANLSNASPSGAHPWGFPGPSNFSNGVAMNRPSYVLAASVPGLLLGLMAGRATGRPPTTNSLVSRAAAHLGLLAAGAWMGARLGAQAAASASPEAVSAFWLAHALLAAIFYAIGLAGMVIAGRLGPALGAAVWIGYVALYEHWTRWRVLREIGYPGLQAGALPDWFFTAQALSPLTAYRALLITAHPGFRDYEERAILANAALPPWMRPEVLAMAMALWVVLLLDAMLVAHGVRAWVRARAARDASKAPSEKSIG
jgi:hypothetical protein